MAVKNGEEPISYTQTPFGPEVVFLVGYMKEGKSVAIIRKIQHDHIPSCSFGDSEVKV